MDQETLSITNVCGGAVDEVFQRELAQVLANIGDVNTDAEAPRSIILEFKIKPFKDRSGAQVELAVKSKIVGIETTKGTMFLQRRGITMVAVPHDPRQARLFSPAAPVPVSDPNKKDLQ
jgi:hypothetical protein